MPVAFQGQLSTRFLARHLYVEASLESLYIRDRVRRTPLHYAATFNNISAAATLLAEGASVGVKDQSLQTPLPYAAREGNSDFVKLLIEHETDAREKDGFMQMCLQISIRRPSIATIEFMLQTAPLIHNSGQI
jgi:ankyrin repeat protein